MAGAEGTAREHCTEFRGHRHPWSDRRVRAAAVDFTRHVEHRTLSQSKVSRPEKMQGRDASGVVLSENIWT